MSFKIDLTASKIDAQISVFKEFPYLAEKHYRPAVVRDVVMLYASILPTIPVLTGKARDGFGSKVTGRGFNLKGQVGWYDKNDPWYINVVEYGAPSHEIELKPINKSVLAWPGGFSKGHTVNHPGFSARGFMAAGLARVEPVIEQDLAEANDRIVADLAAI